MSPSSNSKNANFLREIVTSNGLTAVSLKSSLDGLAVPVDGELLADVHVDGELLLADVHVDGELLLAVPVDGELLADVHVDIELLAVLCG